MDSWEIKRVAFNFVDQYEGHILNSRQKISGEGILISFYNEGRCTKNENKIKTSNWLNSI